MKIENRESSWRDIAMFGLFAIIALGLMAPLLFHWRTRLYGAGGDSEIYAYMAGWMAHAVPRGQSPFFDPHLNFPDGLMLTATDVPYLHLLLALPITIWLGPVAALNSIILACHFLSGYLPYQWIKKLTGSRFGGLVAGLAFVLTPYRIVHSGHLNLVATHVLVLFFWALDNALSSADASKVTASVEAASSETASNEAANASASTCRVPGGQFSRRSLGMLALATFYTGTTSQYYLAICLVCGGLYTLLWRWRRDSWRTLPKLLAPVLCGALLSALPYLALIGSGTFRRSDILDSREFSASALDFFTPSASHPLWGAWITRSLNILDSEQTIYLGLVALVLALFALRGEKSSAQPQQSRAENAPALTLCRRRAWLGVIAAAAVVALGTDFHLAGQPLAPAHPFWLPAYYLGQLPFASIMRVWARFGIIAVLLVALLAGIGAARWLGRIPRAQTAQRSAVAVACLAMLMLDLWPGLPVTSALSLQPIDRWLARQNGDFAVAFLPISQEVGPVSHSAYASLWHHKRLPATVHPRHMPPAFRRFRHSARTFPDARSIAALQAIGFKYLLLDSAQFDGIHAANWRDVESALRRWPGARFAGRIGTIIIVQLPQPKLQGSG